MISIIVPIYNIEEYLSQCISAILKQTYSNFELILVDDGSTDASGRIADQFRLTDKRIRTYHTKNNGVSSARNFGIDMAQGEFITFIDGDDHVSTDCLQLLYETLNESRSDISILGIQTRKASEEENVLRKPERIESFSSNEAIESMLYERDVLNSPCAKLYRAEIFNNLRFRTDIAIGEDMEINYRLFLKAKKVSFSPLNVYYYLPRQGSAMQSVFDIKRRDSLTATEYIYENIQIHHPNLSKAARNKLFSEALSIASLIPTGAQNLSEDRKKCLNIIIKNRASVLLDRKTKFKHRLYAIVALVNADMIVKLLSLKNKIRNRIKLI